MPYFSFYKSSNPSGTVFSVGKALNLQVNIKTVLAAATLLLVVIPTFTVPLADSFPHHPVEGYAQHLASNVNLTDQVFIRGTFNGTFDGQLKGALDDAGNFVGEINGKIFGEMSTISNNTEVFFKTNGTFSGEIIGAISSENTLTGVFDGTYLGPVNGTFREVTVRASVAFTLKDIGEQGYDALGEFEGLYEFLQESGIAFTTYTDAKQIFFGGSLEKDDRLIMRVKATSPAFLRGGVYDTYTGESWIRSDTRRYSIDQSGLVTELRNAENKRFIEARIQIVNRTSTVIFTPAIPVKIEATPLIRSILTIDNYDTIREEVNSSFIEYSVISYVPTLDPVALKRVRVPAPFNEAGPQYLQISGSLPQRVWDLTRKVTLNATNNYDLAKSLEAYLRTSGEYNYTLKAPRTPPGVDAVDYFLFESKQGHSLHFASAMVAMSRTLGIASRLVAGYGPAGFANGTGIYDVKRSDLHFVPELYFGAQAGWIPFEPTPGGSAQPELFEFHDLPIYVNALASETVALGRDTLFRLNSTVELLIQPTSSGAKIESNLFDELKRPITGADIVIEVDQYPLTVSQTDSDGRITKEFLLGPGVHSLRLVYLGTPSFKGTEASYNFVVPQAAQNAQVAAISSGTSPILEAILVGGGIVAVATTVFLKRKHSRRKLGAASLASVQNRSRLVDEALTQTDPKLRLLAVYNLLNRAAVNRYTGILPSLTPHEFSSVFSERLPSARPFLERATDVLEKYLYKGTIDFQKMGQATEDLLVVLKLLDQQSTAAA